MYALQMTRLLSDEEPRVFSSTELFSWNNFHKKWKSKNKVFFIETNLMPTLLEHVDFRNPKLEVLTGEGFGSMD